MTKRTIIAVLSIVAAAALTTVCKSFFAKDQQWFSHKRHIEDYNSDCENCHNMKADPPVFGGMSTCEGCHDESLSKPVLKHKAKRYEIIFSHDLHNNVAVCTECHETTAKDKQKRNMPMQSYSRCLSCHEENAIHISPFKCSSCHKQTDKQTRPDNHKKTWLQSHGKAAEWKLDKGHGNDCILCHKQSECQTCHRTMKPKNHTGLWRMKTHGLSASMEKERCKTCHETGVCITCHRNTAPQNHRGTWRRAHGISANTSPEKCRVCHSPSFGSSVNCVECHRGNR